MKITTDPLKGLSAWNKRLRKIRRTLDLTQQEFADKLGLKTSAYRMYEIGKNQPSIEVLQKVSQITGISLDWLLLGKGSFNKHTEFITDREMQMLDIVEHADSNKDKTIRKTLSNLSDMLEPEELNRMSSHFFTLFLMMKCVMAYIHEKPCDELTEDETSP